MIAEAGVELRADKVSRLLPHSCEPPLDTHRACLHALLHAGARRQPSIKQRIGQGLELAGVVQQAARGHQQAVLLLQVPHEVDDAGAHCLRRAQRSLVLTLPISKSQAAALRAQLAVRVDAAYPAAERHPMLRCTARGKPSQAWLLPVGLQCALPEDVVKKIVSRRAWISA